MQLSKPLRRLLWLYVLVLVALSIVAALVGFLVETGGQAMSSSFMWVFFLGGLAWLFLAYLLGGSVSTYRAPVVDRSFSLLHTLPSQSRYLLPSNQAEVRTDLKAKLEGQTGPMLLAILSGLGFFALAVLFSLAPEVGYASLAGATLVLVGILIAGTRGRQETAPA